MTDGWCVGTTFVREGVQGGLFCLLDLPLSLVADTLVLPFTAYQQVRHGSFHPRVVPAVHDEEVRRREAAEDDLRQRCRRELGPGRRLSEKRLWSVSGKSQHPDAKEIVPLPETRRFTTCPWSKPFKLEGEGWDAKWLVL